MLKYCFLSFRLNKSVLLKLTSPIFTVMLENFNLYVAFMFLLNRAVTKQLLLSIFNVLEWQLQPARLRFPASEGEMSHSLWKEGTRHNAQNR